jgi:hypothetical protein|tara:strand:- start:1224 stop:1694 length:471 start_codon:yes stop_codon:yes gene_type:complete
MAQWLSHIRQYVFTGGKSRDFSITIFSPEHSCQSVVVVIAVAKGNSLFILELKGARETVLNTFWIAAAQVALETDQFLRIKVDNAKWAGQHTYFAPYAAVGIDQNSICLDTATYGRGGATVHAPGDLAMDTSHGDTGRFFGIVVYANSGITVVIIT